MLQYAVECTKMFAKMLPLNVKLWFPYLIIRHKRMISWNVVSQPNSGERYKYKIEAIKKGPIWLQKPEKHGWYEDRKKKIHRTHQS